MVYLFSTCDNDMFRYVYGALEEPLTIVTLPESISNNKIARKIAHLLWRFGIFIKWNLFGKEFNKFLDSIKPEDKVIFYARFPEPILNIVPYMKKGTKCSLWIWDPLINLPFIHQSLSLLKKLNICISTFDPNDAEMSDINFIPQLYNFNSPCKSQQMARDASKPEFDCYFMGHVGEYKRGYLDKLEDLFQKENISYYYYKVNAANPQYMSYKQNLDNIERCKVIIEVNNECQSGLTLRAMESLCYRKKLITNNIHIKKYDFYHKNNIYIIGEDDDFSIVDFVNTPYFDISQEIINNYDVNNWIKKLFY